MKTPPVVGGPRAAGAVVEPDGNGHCATAYAGARRRGLTWVDGARRSTAPAPCNMSALGTDVVCNSPVTST